MPPNRSCDNVDEVDELDGEGEGEIQTIRIVNSEKGGKVMCEICSSILKICSIISKTQKVNSRKL